MRLRLSLLLLATLAPPLAAQGAPPVNATYRMELPPLRPLDISQAALYPRCARLPGRGNLELPNHICAQLQHEGGWRLLVYVNAEPGSGPTFLETLALPDPDGDASFGIEYQMVAGTDGAALFMVDRSRSTGYSGGGANRTDLLLIRAGDGIPARIVAELPNHAARNVRACFSNRDRVRRRGACQDQYELTASLTLDPAAPTGPPRFLLVSRAHTYPGHRTAESDSTTAPPLTARDLDWWDDPVCSYRRALTWDAATARYVADRPLPACADYLDI